MQRKEFFNRNVAIVIFLPPATINSLPNWIKEFITLEQFIIIKYLFNAVSLEVICISSFALYMIKCTHVCVFVFLCSKWATVHVENVMKLLGKYWYHVYVYVRQVNVFLSIVICLPIVFRISCPQMTEPTEIFVHYFIFLSFIFTLWTPPVFQTVRVMFECKRTYYSL